MNRVSRLVIALTIFISGAALVPVIGLPSQGFNWQRFADVYAPAMLDINHLSGQPGSFFTIIGMNFAPNITVTINANGVTLGSLQTSSNGDFLCIIDTMGADPGFYLIEGTGIETASTQFTLDVNEPLWAKSDVGTVFTLPSNTAMQRTFLPVILR